MLGFDFEDLGRGLNELGKRGPVRARKMIGSAGRRLERTVTRSPLAGLATHAQLGASILGRGARDLGGSAGYVAGNAGAVINTAAKIASESERVVPIAMAATAARVGVGQATMPLRANFDWPTKKHKATMWAGNLWGEKLSGRGAAKAIEERGAARLKMARTGAVVGVSSGAGAYWIHRRGRKRQAQDQYYQ